MKESSPTSSRRVVLWLGDALVLALVTIAGFASHDLLGPEGAAEERMLATFIPFLIAWLLVAPHLGAFDLRYATDARQLWRPFWAMILSAPLGALLRGVWLGTPIQPIFVVVVGGLNALAILAWRTIYLLLASKTRQVHG